MQLAPFPFQVTDWAAIEKTIYQGITGMASWQVFMMNDIRIRIVEYSVNYLADHWCSKGHIIYCIEGEMTTELDDGSSFLLCAGMTYHVGDQNGAHRTASKSGCRLFIVD